MDSSVFTIHLGGTRCRNTVIPIMFHTGAEKNPLNSTMLTLSNLIEENKYPELVRLIL